MSATYSTYEAKAKLSEILRRVRAGERIVISYRGQDVAEVIPVEQPETMDAKLDRLERDGTFERRSTNERPGAPLARRPGALERFLASRE